MNYTWKLLCAASISILHADTLKFQKITEDNDGDDCLQFGKHVSVFQRSLLLRYY